MTTRSGIRRLLLAGALLVALAPVRAHAQATHTWISGVGDDVNPCSRTAPCRTWAGAISKTAAGGEIGTLDPGSFGAVTITKAITLDANGVLASTVASLTNGIIVNAGVNDHVALRNLNVNGVGDGTSPGLTGVRFLGGKSLTIERSVIANFDAYGIQHTSPGTLVLHDTVIRNTAQGAIHVEAASGTPNVMILDSRLEDGAFGLHLVGNALATVRNTHASKHAGPGFWADGAGVDLALVGDTSAMNAVGVQSSAGADVRIGEMTVFGNSTMGLLEETGGTITPFSGALVAGNPVGGGPNTCGIQVQSPVVNCADATCPTPSCPQASCPQPNVQIAGSLGPCKKCKTKAGKTTCTGCPVNFQ
jgi:hypothetical protein